MPDGVWYNSWFFVICSSGLFSSFRRLLMTSLTELIPKVFFLSLIQGEARAAATRQDRRRLFMITGRHNGALCGPATAGVPYLYWLSQVKPKLKFLYYRFNVLRQVRIVSVL